MPLPSIRYTAKGQLNYCSFETMQRVHPYTHFWGDPIRMSEIRALKYEIQNLREK